MEACQKCKGEGVVRFRDPVLHRVRIEDCSDCLCSGKMDKARELAEQYQREWYAQWEKERPLKWNF